MPPALRTPAAALAMFLAATAGASAIPISELERAALGALSAIYQRSADAIEMGRNAHAILVFPGVHKVGAGLAVTTGTGVLFEEGKATGFYNLTGFAAGLELGVQKYNHAIFFEDERALANLYNSAGFRIGLDSGLVLGEGILLVEPSTQNIHSGIFVYSGNRMGLMASLGLEVAKITQYNPGD